MNEIIRIKNVSFAYNDNLIIDNLNFDIKEGEWVSIVGPNGSGKSTLVKILVGLLKCKGEIRVNGYLLNNSNIMKIREKIGIIFENVDNQFVTETVRSEIAFALENLLYSPDEILGRVDVIAAKLKIKDIIECDPHRLSGGQKQKVALATALALKPKILILDEALSMIDGNERKEILEIIKLLNTDENLTIINVTHNLEESYYGNRVIVINDGQILIDGSTKEVLKREKILTKIGLEIPFMVDLSMKLKLYGLIDDIIFDMDEMVGMLWK
jgi:energy-coupling factor transport system ATP-binding protein